MTKILKSKYKQYKKDHVFDLRKKKIKLSGHRYNLRDWDRLEYLKNKKIALMSDLDLSTKYTPGKFNFRLKQEIKSYYGNILESTYQKYNNKNQFIINIFERRLDVVLFRIHGARSIYQAKQLINHGHILINGKSINLPSYLLNPNDIISISPKLSSGSLIKYNLYVNYISIKGGIKKSNLPFFFGGIINLKNKLNYGCITPLYLEVDYKRMKAILIDLPNKDNLVLSFPLKEMGTRKISV